MQQTERGAQRLHLYARVTICRVAPARGDEITQLSSFVVEPLTYGHERPRFVSFLRTLFSKSLSYRNMVKVVVLLSAVLFGAVK